MKKIIFISLITISVFAEDTKAQAVPDTLAYLQTIVNNKAAYIGQPFSVLMDSLQIQIKYFSRFPGLPNDMTKETSTSFSFYNPVSMDDFYLIYPVLRISWQPIKFTLPTTAYCLALAFSKERKNVDGCCMGT